MNSIFSQGPVYGTRLILAVILSVSLIAADIRYPQLDTVRQYLAFVINPVIWIVNVPEEIMDWGNETFAPRETLQNENETLRIQLLVLQRKTQELAIVQAENRRLRELVNASKSIDEEILAAQLIGLDSDAFTHQVIINKGANEGVFIGQPVLDAKGLMGQIIQVDSLTSRALLVADANHAVPVQVNRNGVRAIAVGNGSLGEMELMFVPDTADIILGDLLVTSGLGNKFPEGYPVATVASIEHDPGEHFAKVIVKPLAELNRSRHVLLVMNSKEIMGELHE